MSALLHWSRLKGFFEFDIAKRRAIISSLPLLVDEADFAALDQGLTLSEADRLSENVIGSYSLPYSVAANFVVDNKAALVPMVTEEPSIVAACSKVAKLVARCGGFHTRVDRSLLTGQIQLYDMRDVDRCCADFLTHKEEILVYAQSLCPRMTARGGGIVDIGHRVLPSKKIGPMLIIEPVMDVVDAMGANALNSLLESLARFICKFFDAKLGLRILSNLCDRRLASARCVLSFDNLSGSHSGQSGAAVAQKLLVAHAFAEADPYRACTHNKGILNGIDAVAIASGNDFRAIEAGAHAYAARTGTYQPLTSIAIDSESQTLNAELTVPLSVGVVGGICSTHPGVRLSHKILGDFSQSSGALSAIMASVGLSQSLAALLALSQEGIQRGHMKLHRKKFSHVPTVKELNPHSHWTQS